ncbi:MAG: ATP synthase F1 subunit epsilon [Pirellulales bacterium]
MAKAPSITVTVVTPEATLLDTTADFVALPLFDGEIGVALNHAPFIGRLGYGELRVVQGGATSRYYIDGGFVQTADNVISVLTNHASPAEKIDAAVAREQLSSAQRKPATSDELLAQKQKLVEQARAKLRLAGKR